jgi:hypothetical protein
MREIYEQTMALPFAVCFPWELHRDVRKYVTNLAVAFLFTCLRMSLSVLSHVLINRLEIVWTVRSPSPCPLPQVWGRGLG